MDRPADAVTCQPSQTDVTPSKTTQSPEKKRMDAEKTQTLVGTDTYRLKQTSPRVPFGEQTDAVALTGNGQTGPATLPAAEERKAPTGANANAFSRCGENKPGGGHAGGSGESAAQGTGQDPPARRRLLRLLRAGIPAATRAARLLSSRWAEIKKSKRKRLCLPLTCVLERGRKS